MQSALCNRGTLLPRTEMHYPFHGFYGRIKLPVRFRARNSTANSLASWKMQTRKRKKKKKERKREREGRKEPRGILGSKEKNWRNSLNFELPAGYTRRFARSRVFVSCATLYAKGEIPRRGAATPSNGILIIYELAGSSSCRKYIKVVFLRESIPWTQHS